MEDLKEHKLAGKRKRSKGPLCITKRKVKSKAKEFIGWGSGSLIEFLASIGRDTSKKLSQYDVDLIVTVYIHENKLLHPEKKKKVLCDARLQSVFGRKSVNKNEIFKLLEAHFVENREQSDEDEDGYTSEVKIENVLMACRRQTESVIDRKSLKEVALHSQQSFFASIVAENIKLVYLKRSLVEELLKQSETFEGKLIGSFIRVKSDQNDYCRNNSHQLLQVTGISRVSRTGEINSEILLQVSMRQAEVCISMLSDNDFSEEECKDLCQKVNDGLFNQPTVVELEQKARSLHEDITKHWIVKELARLQNLIDHANEKGWREELGDGAVINGTSASGIVEPISASNRDENEENIN